jgi:hypothetical protein
VSGHVRVRGQSVCLGVHSFIHLFILKFHESSLVTTGLGCRTCQITICTVSTNVLGLMTRWAVMLTLRPLYTTATDPLPPGAHWVQGWVSPSTSFSKSAFPLYWFHMVPDHHTEHRYRRGPYSGDGMCFLGRKSSNSSVCPHVFISKTIHFTCHEILYSGPNVLW